MRRGDLDRAEAILAQLHSVLPQHVPGRGHRAEVAIARGQLEVAEALLGIAARRGVSLAALVAEIDGNRPNGANLSSALRVCVLEDAARRCAST